MPNEEPPKLTDLIGKHINKVSILNGDLFVEFEDNLFVEFDNKVMALSPEGDCCAHCYIESICFSEALIDATVNAIEDLEVASQSFESDSEVIDCWGYRILTSKGICNIEMRVAHNGYYGGELNTYYVNQTPDKAKPLEDFS